MVYEILAIGGIIGILIGMLSDPYKKVSLKRKLQRKKNFGILHMITKGRTIKTLIVDFNQDKFKMGNATWLLRPGRIYRMITKTSGTKKVNDDYEIGENKIKYQSGVPVVFCSIDDMVPLHFSNEPAITGTRNPYHVGATLAKEISAAEAEIMLKQKSKLLKLILGAILIAAAAAGISFMGFNAINQLGLEVSTRMSNIETQLAVIKASLEASGTVVIP